MVQYSSHIKNSLSSLLMTVISLATEHSDPVAPQRMGGGWGDCVFLFMQPVWAKSVMFNCP